MKIACNYSPELMKLLDAGEVEIDYIKLALYPEFMGKFDPEKTDFPILVHGINPGSPERIGVWPPSDFDWEGLNKRFKKYKTPHLGVHLDMHQGDIPEFDEEKIIKRLIEGAKKWQEKIDLPFLLENVPCSYFYCRRGVLSQVGDPEIITKVCLEAGTGFLLDLAHARVTAFWKNMSPWEYIKKLPLHLMREIHLNSPLFTEEGLRDKHLELNEEDYELLQKILSCFPVEILTLEYGGPGEKFKGRSEKEAIYRQVNKLRELVE